MLYTDDIDILLLDEPDAHLHTTLQSELLTRLMGACVDNKKQILASTHSVEMIKRAPLNMVFSMDTHKYLAEEASRVATLNGLGSEYFPKLDLLKRYKRLIFVENESDKGILTILGQKCGIQLPEDIVFWENTDSHANRGRVFFELHKIIPDLKCISLRDRDMDNPRIIGERLDHKGMLLDDSLPILYLEWHRKNIESYLLCPRAIAEATGQTVDMVKNYFQTNFALALSDRGYVAAEPPEPIITLDGKHIFIQETIGLEHAFGCSKYDVASKIRPDEVCEDIKIFLTRVKEWFDLV